MSLAQLRPSVAPTGILRLPGAAGAALALNAMYCRSTKSVPVRSLRGLLLSKKRRTAPSTPLLFVAATLCAAALRGSLGSSMYSGSGKEVVAARPCTSGSSGSAALPTKSSSLNVS